MAGDSVCTHHRHGDDSHHYHHHQVEQQQHFSIHYRTSWTNPLLHFSTDHGRHWSSAPFHPRKISPIGPDFRVAVLDFPHHHSTPPSSPQHTTTILFVLTDGSGLWDNPAPECSPEFTTVPTSSQSPSSSTTSDHANTLAKHNYRVSKPGVYVLYAGQLTRHDPTVLRAPALTLVTDIDGTLYGNNDALARFYNLWSRHLALAGAVLIFNTGRSLESVLDLLRQNKKNMPVPVAVISRVGAFVHWLRPLEALSGQPNNGKEDNPTSGSGQVGVSGSPHPHVSTHSSSPENVHHAHSGHEWIDFHASPPSPDPSWRQALARVEGWDQSKVRSVLHRAIDAAAASPRGFWLEDGVATNNPYHLAVSVQTDKLEEVLALLRKELAEDPVKYIVSGEGQHRYLDVAVSSAGKLGASLHVCQMLPGKLAMPEHAVFCGDSGNDADALQGDLKGIVVANAQQDLLECIAKNSLTQPGLHYSKSRYPVFHADYPCADGIIHGLQKHGFVR